MNLRGVGVRVGTVLLLSAAVGACRGSWGPLAVIQDASRDSLDVVAASGELSIGSECVTISRGSEIFVLVWRDGQTRWDAILHQILFEGHGGQVVLRDRDSVALSGVPFAEGVRNDADWVAPIAASCKGRAYLVQSVVLLGAHQPNSWFR